MTSICSQGVRRAVAIATLVFVCAAALGGQAPSVLHITIQLADADGSLTPVARHVLLISDNPPSAPPREITTAADGTADVKLRPGNYTVESDRPVAFAGKAYQWTQIVDIVAGRETTLELTAANAEIDSASDSASSPEDDPSFLLPRWQQSVVSLWTPVAHASGFLIDQKGLVATSQRAIGTATSIEVQVTRTLKVAATVVDADAVRDVAVLWIDPKAVESVRPLPLGCDEASRPAVEHGQEIFAIGAPLVGQTEMSPGTADRGRPRFITAEFVPAPGSPGGPVFAAGGAVVGITSLLDARSDETSRDVRVVPVENACLVVADAEKNMKESSPPAGTRLPVEPALPYPVNLLEAAAKVRAGSLNPYQMSSSDFDVAFITPVLVYGARNLAQRSRVMDFSNWAEYVENFPPVLLVRATPKFVEGFWTMVARGAARMQGVSLPPIKRFKAGFLRMQVFCGEAEVTPIHPFLLEPRISDTEAIREGLYVFDPAALGPHCGTVKLVMYSEKTPEKSETRMVEPNVLQQIWQDFAPYRDR
jgi:S1-C subfamily serine protease